MFRQLLVVVVVLVGVLLIWRIAGELGSGGPERRRGGSRPIPVEVVAVRRANMKDIRTFTGSIDAGSYFVVAPKVGGRLEKLEADIGDEVSSGRVIAYLDDDEYAQQLEQVRAELKVAQASLAQAGSALEIAKREFERVKALREKRISSEADLDVARSQYEAQDARYQVAKAEVARGEAALRAAEVRLSYTKIAISWDGGSTTRVVGERFVDEGAMLSANTPIVSVLDIMELTATIDVIERDYADIREGQEVSITTDAFPRKVFKGTVERIAPLIKKTSRQARVEIKLPNPTRELKPGMFVRARIEFGAKNNAQIVPRDALVMRSEQEGVYCVDTEQNTAHFVVVERGFEDGDDVEILSPALDRPVVTLGRDKVTDGGAVLVSGSEKAGER